MNRILADLRAGQAKIKEIREASGCEALFREADALEEQACAISDRIYETQATSFAGILAQLECAKDEQDDWTLLDTITAGVNRLAEAYPEPRP